MISGGIVYDPVNECCKLYVNLTSTEALSVEAGERKNDITKYIHLCNPP